jgi:hypothetical protein
MLSTYKFELFLNKTPLPAYNLLSSQPHNQTLTNFDARMALKSLARKLIIGLSEQNLNN